MFHIKWQEKGRTLDRWGDTWAHAGAGAVAGAVASWWDNPTGVLLHLLLKDLTSIIRSSARGLPTSEPGGRGSLWGASPPLSRPPALSPASLLTFYIPRGVYLFGMWIFSCKDTNELFQLRKYPFGVKTWISKGNVWLWREIICFFNVWKVWTFFKLWVPSVNFSKFIVYPFIKIRILFE